MTSQVVERNQSIDVLRGIAITLVVAGHANRGVIDEIQSYKKALSFADYAIYSIHMPLFFYLSGYFCFFSLKKQRSLIFLRSRMQVIVRPYIIWSAITVAASVIMLHYTYIRTPVTILDLLQIGWRPIGVLWFLYALFVMQVAATLLWRRPIIALIGVIALELLINGAVADNSNELLAKVIAHAPFFFTGLLVASAINRPVPEFSDNRFLLLLIFSSIWLLGIHISFIIGVPSSVSLIVLPICAAGILALAGISTQLVGTYPGIFLAKLGRASMPIYLLHIFVLALVPRILKMLNVDEALLRIVFGTLIGVLGAYLASVVIHRMRLSRFFGFYG